MICCLKVSVVSVGMQACLSSVLMSCLVFFLVLCGSDTGVVVSCSAALMFSP